MSEDIPALLSRGAVYVSGGDGTWTEIGWTEDAPALTFTTPAILGSVLTARGPLSATFTFPLDRAHARRLKRWMRAGSNSGPLCINGREYSRRQKKRRGRRSRDR